MKIRSYLLIARGERNLGIFFLAHDSERHSSCGIESDAGFGGPAGPPGPPGEASGAPGAAWGGPGGSVVSHGAVLEGKNAVNPAAQVSGGEKILLTGVWHPPWRPKYFSLGKKRFQLHENRCCTLLGPHLRIGHDH